MVRAYFEGHDKTSAALKAMIAKAEAETPEAINGVLRLVASQERTLLRAGSHTRGTKTGSPPGSPPWRISGDLMDSVTVRRAKPSGVGKWEGLVGPTSPYGRIQEMGGWTGAGHRSYLPPRPHLRPAWDLVRPAVSSKFRAVWG